MFKHTNKLQFFFSCQPFNMVFTAHGFMLCSVFFGSSRKNLTAKIADGITAKATASGCAS